MSVINAPNPPLKDIYVNGVKKNIANQLAPLESGASQSEIFKGKEAYDDQGNLIVGTYEADALDKLREQIVTLNMYYNTIGYNNELLYVRGNINYSNPSAELASHEATVLALYSIRKRKLIKTFSREISFTTSSVTACDFTVNYLYGSKYLVRSTHVTDLNKWSIVDVDALTIEELNQPDYVSPTAAISFYGRGDDWAVLRSNSTTLPPVLITDSGYTLLSNLISSASYYTSSSYTIERDNYKYTVFYYTATGNNTSYRANNIIVIKQTLENKYVSYKVMDVAKYSSWIERIKLDTSSVYDDKLALINQSTTSSISGYIYLVDPVEETVKTVDVYFRSYGGGAAYKIFGKYVFLGTDVVVYDELTDTTTKCTLTGGTRTTGTNTTTSSYTGVRYITNENHILAQAPIGIQYTSKTSSGSDTTSSNMGAVLLDLDLTTLTYSVPFKFMNVNSSVSTTILPEATDGTLWRLITPLRFMSIPGRLTEDNLIAYAISDKGEVATLPLKYSENSYNYSYSSYRTFIRCKNKYLYLQPSSTRSYYTYSYPAFYFDTDNGSFTYCDGDLRLRATSTDYLLQFSSSSNYNGEYYYNNNAMFEDYTVFWAYGDEEDNGNNKWMKFKSDGSLEEVDTSGLAETSLSSGIYPYVKIIGSKAFFANTTSSTSTYVVYDSETDTLSDKKYDINTYLWSIVDDEEDAVIQTDRYYIKLNNFISPIKDTSYIIRDSKYPNSNYKSYVRNSNQSSFIYDKQEDRFFAGSLYYVPRLAKDDFTYDKILYQTSSSSGTLQLFDKKTGESTSITTSSEFSMWVSDTEIVYGNRNTSALEKYDVSTGTSTIIYSKCPYNYLRISDNTVLFSTSSSDTNNAFGFSLVYNKEKGEAAELRDEQLNLVSLYLQSDSYYYNEGEWWYFTLNNMLTSTKNLCYTICAYHDGDTTVTKFLNIPYQSRINMPIQTNYTGRFEVSTSAYTPIRDSNSHPILFTYSSVTSNYYNDILLSVSENTSNIVETLNSNQYSFSTYAQYQVDGKTLHRFPYAILDENYKLLTLTSSILPTLSSTPDAWQPTLLLPYRGASGARIELKDFKTGLSVPMTDKPETSVNCQLLGERVVTYIYNTYYIPNYVVFMVT